MENLKILSGQAIVSKGVTKIDASLPEIGLKDVIPNGSWLEQKQIQAALEGRKHLIEVERIEKCGTLSHAIWQDDLQLAEVTQKSGGYWQYLGHNVGKTLYLRPEEALFLMEVNCLLLKHNDLVVSLQKAYSLLLNKTTATQYRVYSSLSRLGYKVFKHKTPNIKKESNNCLRINPMHKFEDSEKLNTEDIVDNKSQPITASTLEVLDSLINVNGNSVPNNGVENGKNTELNEDPNKTKSLSDQVIERNILSMVMDVDENAVNINNGTVDSQPTITMAVENTISNGNEIIKDNNEPNQPKSNKDPEENARAKDSDVMELNEVTSLKTNTESPDKIVLETSAVSCEDKSTALDKKISTSDDAVVESSETVPNDNRSKLDYMEISVECDSRPDSSIPNTNNGGVNASAKNAIAIEVDSADSDVVMDLDTPNSQDFPTDNVITEENSTSKPNQALSDLIIRKRNQIFHNYVTKLKRLTTRRYKPSDSKTIEKYFENVPDLFRKEVITINVPDQQHIPKNIFVNKSSYLLNLKEIKRKSERSTSIDSAAYSSSDEVNDSHVRRIRSHSHSEYSQNVQFANNIRYPPRPTHFFRPFNFWRPQNNPNYVQFNMFFQRPCYTNLYFPRFQYHPRPNPLLRSFSFPNNINVNNNNSNTNPSVSRKRMRNAKAVHLQSVKNLAQRLKQLILGGNSSLQNIESLHRLLFAFNARYNAKLRLSKHFDVVDDETIVETINLEDDDESNAKKRRLSEDGKFDENLNVLRQIAQRLKDLEAKDKVSSKHRRAMSKAIKTFNKYYDADVYMNNDFEIINKRLINLDSDSESDCVVNEPKKVHKRKKLRNPFNILKRLSEKHDEFSPSTSRENKNDVVDTEIEPDETKYSESITKVFNDKWLPQESDFGRAEVVRNTVMNSRFIDTIKEEYLFNFMKNHLDEFNNWLEAKIAYLQHLEETEIAYQNEHEQMPIGRQSVPQSGLKPLIDAEDCSDMPSVLEKLRIIKNNKEIIAETSLCIDFDVYNRDVQNFRKTNPPKPHFRVICVDESSNFPSSGDIMALHSRYEDNVPIVFAAVGVSSVSYLQINPIDLPVYVASVDVD